MIMKLILNYHLYQISHINSMKLVQIAHPPLYSKEFVISTVFKQKRIQRLEVGSKFQIFHNFEDNFKEKSQNLVNFKMFFMVI
jgi:hypothetical protein